MICFDKVSKVYSGGHQALQKVSFHLRKGEMAFLTGHSGAGKSTLLKLISVMERPTDGRVFFHGDDVSHIQRSQINCRARTVHHANSITSCHKMLWIVPGG